MPAKLGPMLVKYLQNLSAISSGSVIALPSDSNDEGKGALHLRLFIVRNRRSTFLEFYFGATVQIKYIRSTRPDLCNWRAWAITRNYIDWLINNITKLMQYLVRY